MSSDDIELFRNAVGDVRSVANDQIEPSVPKKPVRLRSAERDDRSVMKALLDELSDADLLESGEHLAYASPGIQRGVLRKLRSGKYAVQSEIDLHGLTVDAARTELSEFLRAAQDRRHLCVRIIHGKGRRNADAEPRLKPAVNAWLQRNNQVLAFCSARANDGGTGAVYVLLKRR